MNTTPATVITPAIESINFKISHMPIAVYDDNDKPTIKGFGEWAFSEVDCNPVGQRPSVQNSGDNSKSISIIESMISIPAINIGQVTITRVYDSIYKYESIDGGHRKRAILEFLAGEFKVKVDGELYFYNELPTIVKNRFDQYKISLCTYTVMSNEMKGKLFCTINQTTDVNHQQKRNAQGNTRIANLTRKMVRTFTINGKMIDEVHPLFHTTSGKKKHFAHIQQTNSLLRVDEFVSRLLYRCLDNCLIGEKGDKQLDEMYSKSGKTDKDGVLAISEKDFKIAEKHLKEHLDFLKSMADGKSNIFGNTNKAKLAWKELNCLSSLFFHYNYIYGPYGKGWYLGDANKFYRQFRKSYLEVSVDLKKNWQMLHGLEYETAETSVKQTFNNYCTVVNGNYTTLMINQMIIWLFGALKEGGIGAAIKTQSIIVLDKRCFTDAQKEAKLYDQNGLCAYDDKKLLYADAEGHHNIAFSKGKEAGGYTSGEEGYKNLKMVRACWNKVMGSMSIEEYKKSINMMKENKNKKNEIDELIEDDGDND
jgi:hypothetical protein